MSFDRTPPPMTYQLPQNLTPEIEEASLLLLRNSWEFNLKLEELIRPYGLNFARFFALGYINAVNRPISPKELIDLSQGQQDGTLAILSHLESSQYIKKQYDLRNGFTFLITAKGKELIDTVSPSWCMIVQHYWSGLSTQDSLDLARILKKMVQLKRPHA